MSASTVRNREGRSGHPWVLKTTVVRGGAEIPRAEAEKTGRNGSKSGRRERLEDEGREGESRVGSGSKRAEGRRRPAESEPGGRLKYQRESAHREAAQFNGIVSGGPTPAWGKAIARAGPPDTTLFILRPYVPVFGLGNSTAGPVLGGRLAAPPPCLRRAHRE